MKLFKKNHSKKPLTDKAKAERKEKRKKIIKRVFDILIYGFAIFMLFGLLIGSCNQKPKTGSAYYHADSGYSSIQDVLIEENRTNLRFYFDSNYNMTFPGYDTLFNAFPGLAVSGSNSFPSVAFDNSYSIDNVTYRYLAITREVVDNVYHYEYVISPVAYKGHASAITILKVFSNGNISITRADILNTLFNGNYNFYVSYHNTNNDRLFQYLTYYFGELGYNRITYDMPVNVMELSYLFVNSFNTDNVIENGYFFKNDNFPSITPGVDVHGLSTFYDVFLGSFRVNGTYYSSIRFTFSSVYGKRLRSYSAGNFYYDVEYRMPGSNNPILSSNEFYLGYWYLDTISYERVGLSTIVYQSASYEVPEHDSSFYRAYFRNGGWVGDSYSTTTPYRSLFIYYALDSYYSSVHFPFAEDFSQLSQYTYASFLNYIGEAYPSISPGVPVDSTPTFSSVFDWFRLALTGFMPMFAYTLLPGISLGTLFMVPLVMSIILFLVKLFKR